MNDAAPQWIRKDIEPTPRILYAHKLGRGALTFHQVDQLVMAINELYVENKQGKAYLAQHQARAEMNRIFGYGNWDERVHSVNLGYEERIEAGHPSFPKNGRAPVYWLTGYEAACTVTIRDLWGMPLAEYTEFHFEENAPQPNRGEARALALTSVASYALRRALINLGDRLGLGLYNGGSIAAHGQYTAQLEPGVLFQWQEQGQAPAQQVVSAPQQPNHRTIQAEPAVVEQAMPEDPGVPSDYDDAEPDGHGGVRSRTHAAKMNAFRQAQAAQQAAREASRQQGAYPAAGGAMASRLQAGMKVDEPAGMNDDGQQYPQPSGYGHPTAEPDMTAQQYAQENG